MIDQQTAAMARLVGLLGLAISVCIWALGERSERRQVLMLLGAGGSLISALIYFVGAMAVADSGASRVLPRFP